MPLASTGPKPSLSQIAGLCEGITRFDGEPVFVASQLLQLPKRQLQRAVRIETAWRHHAREVPDHAAAVASVDVRCAVHLQLAVDAGKLTAAEAWLIHATRITGHSLGEVARRLDIGYEAAKKRRQRAEARWVTWWGHRPGDDGKDGGVPDGPPERAELPRCRQRVERRWRRGGRATPDRGGWLQDPGEAGA